MLEITRIRNDFDNVVKALRKRGLSGIEKKLNDLIDSDNLRKSQKTEIDKIFNESNNLSKKIGIAFKSGETDEIESLKSKSQELKEKSKKIAEGLKKTENEINEILFGIPNTPDSRVPEGKSDEENKVIYSSKVSEVDKDLKPHWDLIKEFNIIDFEIGNSITGAGFPLYTGDGAILQRALINYFLDFAREEGYTEVQPPILINENSALNTGQLPDKEGQMYKLENENLYLIPTAEVPVTNIYNKKIMDSNLLPIKNAAYTPCFRREAGSWGSHVRGLNRLHQFDKVEIVQIHDKNGSEDALNSMCDHVQRLIESLEIPFRKILLCAGDLGFTSSITYDFEVYAPGQDRWLECSSVSNFLTYQSNRMNLKVKDGKSKELAHTLNGSALALPRILASILENNQEENSIAVPEVLHKYTGFKMISK
ncbi:MAG: serine--tRNA ligase [Flammeovirgaceae bacterium]|nr:serine--tRNA ligase [Flammeovirgaceae bacterium]|tara:strand:- start:561 stop:1832 length:1272 start_codon:yes stop_codon:yes gene_type:complete